MNFYVRFVAAVLGCACVLGCKQGTDKEDKALLVTGDSANVKSEAKTAETLHEGSKFITLSENANPLLATKEYPDPAGQEGQWANATAKEVKYKIVFSNDINAELEVTVTFLKKDAGNSMIKNCSVSVIRNSKEYIMSARVSDQANMGTNNEVRTFITIEAFATLNPKFRRTKKLEGKIAVAYSETQVIEPLE